MKIQVYKLREDGTFDFADTVTCEPNAIPEGYAIDETTDHVYKDGTRPLESELLEQAKADKKKEIFNDCKTDISSGFVSTVTDIEGTPYEFFYDDEAVKKFNGQTNKVNIWMNQYSLGEITQEQYEGKFPISWRTKSHGWVNLTRNEYIQVTDDAEAHERNKLQRRSQIEADIDTAFNNGDLPGINAISW